jgi:uncharacterized protein YbaA (DUF1428 family)
MPRYVDGFVIPIPTRNLARYRRIARRAGEIWMEYGAVEYLEGVGDDLDAKDVVSFKKLLKLKRGETALFSYIVYRSKADRDRVTARVMKDPRIAAMMTEKDSPFDMKRMTYGGFRAIVDLGEP